MKLLLFHRMVWLGMAVAVLAAACEDEPAGNPGGQTLLDADAGGGGDTTADVADVGPDAVDTGTDSGGQDPDTGGADFPDLPDIPDPGPWETGGWIYGWSELGRPLYVEHFGLEGPVLFLMGGIHGNERQGVTVTERLRTALQGGLAEAAGVRIVFVQAANPDGLALRKRHNFNDIDLNRNWPAENFNGEDNNGGPFPLSESETAALRPVVDLADFTGFISYHCCIPIVDWDGPGDALAAAIGAGMDPAFPVNRLGSRPGSLGSYVGLELGRPIITFEFALQAEMDRFVQLREAMDGTQAAISWTLNEGLDPETAGGAVNKVDDSPLDSFVLAESAGGLDIRVDEVTVGDGDPVLLLSGLVDNDPYALWVAEHVRRELLANLVDVPLLMLTSANPDGQQSQSADNSAGDAVAADLFSGDLATPEAEGLDAMIETQAPRLVVHLVGGASDGVAVRGLNSDDVAAEVPAALTMLGESSSDLADYLEDRGIALLELTVANEYGEGDNANDDFFADGNPMVYSGLVRQIIKPEELICVFDGTCQIGCEVDPDCDCDCDFNDAVCEPEEQESTVACACDADCAGEHEPCEADAHCDSWCPTDTDPDCACSCDHNMYCEAAANDSADTCLCDADCGAGEEACSDDDHCDTWCPDGIDPDCP